PRRRGRASSAADRDRPARRLSAQARLGAPARAAAGRVRRRPTRLPSRSARVRRPWHRTRADDPAPRSERAVVRGVRALDRRDHGRRVGAAGGPHQCGDRRHRIPATIKQWLASVDSAEPVLSADDLAFWDEHGYVVVHDAVPAETREAATQAILHHLGARLDDPESWYRHDRRSIMVQYFQHAAFDANRHSPRIHKSFAQLWGTADLWVSTDRV